MNVQEAIDKLDAIDSNDCEAAHSYADQIVLDLLEELGHKDVVVAYDSLVERCSWWVCA